MKTIIENIIEEVSQSSNNPEGFKKSDCAKEIRKALEKHLTN